MYKGSNCDRKSQFSEILTKPLNPRDLQRFRRKLSNTVNILPWEGEP